jgi:hypothetical protein
MAQRVRLLHPTFFTNEELVRLPPLYRLLFAGLWTLADRQGRLEDRPARIKLQLFPLDDMDVDAGLTALEAAKLISRYGKNGHKCIHVINFTAHQRPHPREAESTLPPPTSRRRRGRSKDQPRARLDSAKDAPR